MVTNINWERKSLCPIALARYIFSLVRVFSCICNWYVINVNGTVYNSYDLLIAKADL